MSKRTPKIEHKKQRTQTVSTIRRARVDSSALDFSSNQTFLYRFVYGTKTSMLVAFVLLLSFALPGVESAQASTEDVPVEITEEAEVSVYEEVEETIDTTVVEEVEEEIVSEPVSEEVVVSESEPADIAPDSDIESPDITDDETVPKDEMVIEEEATDNPDTDSDSDTEGEAEEGDEEAEEEETIPLEEEVEATSTDEVIDISENTFETISSVASDSAFSFTKDQCTQLATGSFYCLEPQENTLADALFAAPDADGDMEIFFIRNNEQVQITNNTVDDAAPYYDQNTNTIVWHRLLDDRFQIISYDVEDGEETQLTRTGENNMEPTRQGEYTVWQRWIDGGWNIILHDGDTEEQITKTTSHNVAPYIHGTLVVWNRHTATGEKTIEMYDITTKTYVTIDDPEGLSVSNPRMVFVYDSLHPNGDIVTKGYDVLARKFIELDTLPRDLPEEIPSSDSTGETRALIQSKPSLKSEVEEMTGSGTTTAGLPPIIPEVATSTEALTLDLSATSSPITVVEPLTEVESFDLVIPPLEITSATSTETVQE